VIHISSLSVHSSFHFLLSPTPAPYAALSSIPTVHTPAFAYAHEFFFFLFN